LWIEGDVEDKCFGRDYKKDNPDCRMCDARVRCMWKCDPLKHALEIMNGDNGELDFDFADDKYRMASIKRRHSHEAKRVLSQCRRNTLQADRRKRWL
jgi:hypothetical protein